MAKFYGPIGYATLVETKPGVWEEQITERMYSGEVYRNSRSLQGANQVNDNINIAMEVSIIADPFARDNFHSMRYVGFMGANWKITNVSEQRPRLILTVGGVYTNGQQT